MEENHSWGAIIFPKIVTMELSASKWRILIWLIILLCVIALLDFYLGTPAVHKEQWFILISCRAMKSTLVCRNVIRSSLQSCPIVTQSKEMYTNLKMYPVKSCDAYICEYYYFKLFIKIHYLYPIVCCAQLVVTINHNNVRRKWGYILSIMLRNQKLGNSIQ